MKRPLHILLVEDNPGDVRLTREALREGSIDCQLTVAEKGSEALRILRGEGPRPDIILLDLKLPGHNGFEVLSSIKGDERLRAIPVVVLTSSDDEADVARAYELQANCYVTKPLDSERLAKIVRTLESFWLTVAKLPPREDFE